MPYNPIKELMSYFYFEFNIYLILLGLVALMAFKAMVEYGQMQKNDVKPQHNRGNALFDLAVSILAIIGLCNAMMFQGVLSDLPYTYTRVWTSHSWTLLFGAAIFLIIQIIFLSLKSKKTAS